MSEGGLLERIQAQVADRSPVDWRVVDTQALSRDDLEQFELLRLLDSIALAHSSFQTEAEYDGTDSRAADAPPERAEDETLQSWGRYRLEEKVGKGGFGSVYRAWDPELEMAVAIKILHRRFGGGNLKERLLREGRALAQVKNPNVVRVLNVEQNEGRLGLVMEFLRGETLDAMVAARGMFNEREATVIAEDVCRALAAVHANRLIHRDVKARNIIRERAGRIVLMDFGAGFSADQRRADEDGAVGTPFYMAPELLRGEPASVSSDVYAVGVLLFFLVSRRYPYEAGTVEELRSAQAAGKRLSLIELRPDLPLPFVEVVDRALAFDPRDRHASATALLQSLVQARDAARTWRTWLTRGPLTIAGLGVVLTLAGMVSSTAFNQTLGRAEYATESLADWFVVGRRSMLLPIVLALLGIGATGLAAALRRVLVTFSASIRTIDRDVTRRVGELARRLSLNDPAVSSCWLILATALGAIAAGVYWAPLLVAVASRVATAPTGTLAILSPVYDTYQTNFRMALSLLAALNVAGWYALVRAAAGRGVRLPDWLRSGEIALLVLLYGSMQLPYRLINDNDEFPVVQWGAERCYVLGERADNSLLFCPGMSPRNRIVPKSEPLAPSHSGESLFASFAPPPS